MDYIASIELMCRNSFFLKAVYFWKFFRVFLEIVVIFFSLIFASPIYFLKILPSLEMF